MIIIILEFKTRPLQYLPTSISLLTETGGGPGKPSCARQVAQASTALISIVCHHLGSCCRGNLDASAIYHSQNAPIISSVYTKHPVDRQRTFPTTHASVRHTGGASQPLTLKVCIRAVQQELVCRPRFISYNKTKPGMALVCSWSVGEAGLTARAEPLCAPPDATGHRVLHVLHSITKS